MKKHLVGWGLASAMTLLGITSADNASASIHSFDGFVCRVNVYSTNVTSLPTASLYSEPGCTGTYLGIAQLWRAGFTYPEQSDRLYQGMLTAVSTDRRVTGTWEVNFVGKQVDTLQVNSN